MMKVKIKKLGEDAISPWYASSGAACFDLFACLKEPVFIGDGFNGVIPTGLQFEIPEGYVMMIYSRSGDGFKNDVRLANCVGVIDSDYRGEVMVKLTKDKCHELRQSLTVFSGQRIAQAMIIPVDRVSFEEADTLSDTARGDGGFGSTGR